MNIVTSIRDCFQEEFRQYEELLGSQQENDDNQPSVQNASQRRRTSPPPVSMFSSSESEDSSRPIITPRPTVNQSNTNNSARSLNSDGDLGQRIRHFEQTRLDESMISSALHRANNDNRRTTPASTGITREQSDVDLLLNSSSLASSMAIETPIPHPSIDKRKSWVQSIRQQERFQKPDKFGIVECSLCKFGIFDTSDGNATEKLLTIYKQQLGKMPDETLYRYLAIYWNDHVASRPAPQIPAFSTFGSGSDDTSIPPVNVSAVQHHFEVCYRRRNVEGILFQQIDRLIKIQNRVYENGVFVRTVDDDEQQQADREGIPRPSPVLTQDANGNFSDAYAHTIRTEPPEMDIFNESSSTDPSQNKSSPLFAQMTSMIRTQIDFIKDLSERVLLIEDPTTRHSYEQHIDEQLRKLHCEIRRAQALERQQRRKVDKKYLVHSREAAIFRDYNRAILLTVKSIKDWREVSSFMDEENGVYIRPKKRGRTSTPAAGQKQSANGTSAKPSKLPGPSASGPPINHSDPKTKTKQRFNAY